MFENYSKVLHTYCRLTVDVVELKKEFDFFILIFAGKLTHTHQKFFPANSFIVVFVEYFEQTFNKKWLWRGEYPFTQFSTLLCLNNEYTNVFGLDNGIEILKFDFSIFVTSGGKTGL